MSVVGCSDATAVLQQELNFKRRNISDLQINLEGHHQPVLTIAGFDPSSGAGITADLKTIAAHGLYGIASITAMTVQSTRRVGRVYPLPPGLLTETLDELFADCPPAAVRIGMLGSAPVGQAVVEFLRANSVQRIVLDPILKSSSGTPLLDNEGLQVLKSDLLPLALVVTPNLHEASTLAGFEVSDVESMKLACHKLHELGAKNIVLKGGHLPQPTDLLAESLPDGQLMFREFPGEKIDTPHSHGSGCAFATALACNLALGMCLPDAVSRAKEYVADALRNAYALGKGPGPINHLHAFKNRS
jgi:hydroxymethylpyrimidine/phosphomethylpyrimidine kinase